MVSGKEVSWKKKNNPMSSGEIDLEKEGNAVPVTKIKGQQYTLNEIRFE